MAKRHYSSSRPMKNSINSGAAEAHNSGMIHDDMSAPCNLPTHVIDKYWAPKVYSLSGKVPSDLYRGVEKQLHEDAKDFRREFEPKKY